MNIDKIVSNILEDPNRALASLEVEDVATGNMKPVLSQVEKKNTCGPDLKKKHKITVLEGGDSSRAGSTVSSVPLVQSQEMKKDGGETGGGKRKQQTRKRSGLSVSYVPRSKTTPSIPSKKVTTKKTSVSFGRRKGQDDLEADSDGDQSTWGGDSSAIEYLDPDEAEELAQKGLILLPKDKETLSRTQKKAVTGEEFSNLVEFVEEQVTDIRSTIDKILRKVEWLEVAALTPGSSESNKAGKTSSSQITQRGMEKQKAVHVPDLSSLERSKLTSARSKPLSTRGVKMYLLSKDWTSLFPMATKDKILHLSDDQLQNLLESWTIPKGFEINLQKLCSTGL